jgi:glutamate racemase
MDMKNVGVFATSATINTHAYKYELQKYNPKIHVFETACPNWTSYIEHGQMGTAECRKDIADKMKEMLLHNPNKIILGCTHYPYLLDILSEFAPKSIFIDPAEIFVNFVKTDLQKSKMLNEDEEIGKEEFYVSANPNEFVENSKLFYNVKILPVIA